MPRYWPSERWLSNAICAASPSGCQLRLVKAAGFRNIVAHAYGILDMARVHEAAINGPHDLRAFLRSVRDRSPSAGV